MICYTHNTVSEVCHLFGLPRIFSTVYITYVLQFRRCQGICGSNLGCFGSVVENNDCGVDCAVSAIILVSCMQVLIVTNIG